MPELPEVETVKEGLLQILGQNIKIERIELNSLGLRQTFSVKQIKKAHGQRIKTIRRRAKYLLFELEESYLLSHLGMTGSWRLKESSLTHDHIEIYLSDGRVLVYRDPRRFGQFDLLDKKTWKSDRRFKDLGPEPLDEKIFTEKYLFTNISHRKIKIKSLIMDQKIVVGVGNIYASEALFFAGIHPETLGIELDLERLKSLVESIREILKDAILCGGTTISDFRQAGGEQGYFQNNLYVYGRAGESCIFCNSTIESQVIVGRNSFWCPQCQSKPIIKESSKRSQSGKSSRKKTSRAR